MLLLLSGCSNLSATIVTYYTNKANWTHFKDDFRNCTSVHTPADFALEGTIVNEDATVDSCLDQQGWEYGLQFISSSGAGAPELLNAIYACAGIKNPSSHTIEEILVRLSPRSAAEACLKNRGWQMISESPWVHSDNLNVRSATVTSLPLNDLHKVVAQGKPEHALYRDSNTALTWTMVTDVVYSWEAAVAAIHNLNSSAYGGFSDWHIPTKTEFEELTRGRDESFIKAMLDRITLSKQQLNMNCLYWTNTTPTGFPDKHFAVDLLTKQFSIIGTDGPYACKLLAVRGTGWKKPADESN